MKKSPRISQVLLAVFALSAIMLHSLPGTEACQSEAGHGANERISEAHCLCAHGMETAEIPLSLAAGMVDCGGGCACIPARSQWQSQLPGRLQPEQRGKEPYIGGDGITSSRIFSHPEPDPLRLAGPTRDVLYQDAFLVSLRTVVLLA